MISSGFEGLIFCSLVDVTKRTFHFVYLEGLLLISVFGLEVAVLRRETRGHFQGCRRNCFFGSSLTVSCMATVFVKAE